jgi:succinate-semialdehyde dehydrogenase / glutarate-semialdehyde dehydrogenase
MTLKSEVSEGYFVTDDWHKSTSTYPIYSPATGELLAQVADCGADDAAKAIRISWDAFLQWRKKTPFERSDILTRWFELMMAHQDELATTMSREMGKPIRESRGEVAYAAGFIKWYAEEAKRITGETFPATVGHKRLLANGHPQGCASTGGGVQLYP